MEEVTDENTAIVAAAAASAVVAAVEAMDGRKQHGKVDPTVIEFIYRDLIIPITKDIEVAYLFRRCGKEPPPEYSPDRMSSSKGCHCCEWCSTLTPEQALVPINRYGCYDQH
ncbi:chorismate mutase [Fragilaria crotonensis]|nr:chorismate mutase [Fragilaria crotonensis]